jgi:HTH-type transcriptional regulator/antitoxin HigA
MNWKVLKTSQDYNKAGNRLREIFHATAGSPEEEELELLMLLIRDYDDKHYVLPQLSPLEAIKYKMKERGIKAKDLEQLIGSKGHVSSILSGRREITLKVAIKLKNYFQLPAEMFLPTLEV